MHCNNCNSNNIKTRKNYSHGSGSKGKKVHTCKDCGSSNIAQEQKRNFRRR